MLFGLALEKLTGGARVARTGWNGKGMYLQYIDHYALQTELPPGTRLLPWIGMKTADGGFVPWLASQTDLLAADWQVVE